jgi:mRNA-degrading endonuclease RelE of RelBE toxin-antitoxin system
LTTTRAPSRTSRNSIVRYSAKFSILWKSASARRGTRSFGKPLRHSKFGLWRYRLRDYRIICQLQQAKLIVLVVAIGHRSIVYDD